MSVFFIIQSLKKKDRLDNIKKNKHVIPRVKVFKSINGYNIKETEKALKKSKLRFHHLDFRTYGTLANFLTKVKILKYQIKHNIPYLCFIEDDLILEESFPDFIKKNLHLLKNDVNMLRLDNWGEGYVTSLKGAKNIIKHINELGIVQSIDNQLREFSGKEIRLKNTPWTLVSPTNSGDCLKTEKINNEESKKLYHIIDDNKKSKNTLKSIIIGFFIILLIYLIYKKNKIE